MLNHKSVQKTQSASRVTDHDCSHPSIQGNNLVSPITDKIAIIWRSPFSTRVAGTIPTDLAKLNCHHLWRALCQNLRQKDDHPDACFLQFLIFTNGFTHLSVQWLQSLGPLRGLQYKIEFSFLSTMLLKQKLNINHSPSKLNALIPLASLHIDSLMMR